MSALPSRRARLVTTLALAVLALGVAPLAGCASGRGGLPAAPAAASPILSPAPSDAPAGAPPLPWTIPTTSLGTQRIYAFQFRQRERRGSLALTLRLERADRFSVIAVDRVLRRKLITIEVEGERALTVLHRERSYCWHQGTIDLAALPLGPVATPGIAALLLGVLPVAPAQVAAGEETFLDRDGRRWRYTLAAGWPVRWSLAAANASGEVTFERRGPRMSLLAPAEGLSLRWQLRLAQPLAGSLGTDPQPPAGFVADCAAVSG